MTNMDLDTSVHTLETASQIKKELERKKVWTLIKSIDPANHLRQQANAIRNTVPNQDSCEICGANKGQRVTSIELAHISPVQMEGSSSLNNLKWFCSSERSEHVEVDQWGCHELFDNGCASIDEVRRSEVGLREIMVSRAHKYSVKSQRIRRQHLGEQFRAIRNQLLELNPKDSIIRLNTSHSGIASVSKLHLDFIKTMRLRSLKGILARAFRIAQRASNSKIPEELLSGAFYEFGYVALLAGKLPVAHDWMSKSAITASRDKYRIQSEIMVDMIRFALEGSAIHGDLIGQIEKRIRLLETHDPDPDLHHWAIIEKDYLAMARAVRGDSIDANRLFDENVDEWESRHIGNNFSVTSRVYMACRRGFVSAFDAIHFASSEMANNAAFGLCRGLVGLLGGVRGRPEECRTYLVALLAVLILLKSKNQCFVTTSSGKRKEFSDDQIGHLAHTIGEIQDYVSPIFPSSHPVPDFDNWPTV